jgi:quinol monooxygenase YgiN
MALLALPWRDLADPGGGPLAVSVTRLRLRRWRDTPAFLRAALRLRRDLAREPGAVTLGLAAQPWARTYWTLSAWRDEAALQAYVRSPGHAAAMRRFRPVMTDATSARWTREGGRPSWDEARRRVADAG